MPVSEASCLWKAVKAHGAQVVASRNDLASGTWSWTGSPPKGCSVQSGGDWAAHWNEGGEYTPVQAAWKGNCLAAAAAERARLGAQVTSGRTGLISGNWGHVPKGCSLQSAGDWAAHWNEGPLGGYTPVW